MNVVVHRLPDGRWRVTNAPEGWVDDGRDYPDAQMSDAVFELEADAVREYLLRTSPVDAEDGVLDSDDEEPAED